LLFFIIILWIKEGGHYLGRLFPFLLQKILCELWKIIGGRSTLTILSFLLKILPSDLNKDWLELIKQFYLLKKD